jgi:hypothetical protein
MLAEETSMENSSIIIGDLLLIFGFLILAFCALFTAMHIKKRAMQYVMLGIGFVLLVAQQGCCAALNNFNRAFGGGSGEMWITYLTQILSAVFLLLAGRLVYLSRKQKKDKNT